MDIEFNSIKELYDRLEPALDTKYNELIRNKISYIKKEDIWNYLKFNKWSHAKDLLLHEMVDDILNCDNALLDDYVKRNMVECNVKPNLDSEVDYEEKNE